MSLLRSLGVGAQVCFGARLPLGFPHSGLTDPSPRPSPLEGERESLFRAVSQGGGRGGLTLGYFRVAPSGHRRAWDLGSACVRNFGTVGWSTVFSPTQPSAFHGTTPIDMSRFMDTAAGKVLAWSASSSRPSVVLTLAGPGLSGGMTGARAWLRQKRITCERILEDAYIYERLNLFAR